MARAYVVLIGVLLMDKYAHHVQYACAEDVSGGAVPVTDMFMCTCGARVAKHQLYSLIQIPEVVANQGRLHCSERISISKCEYA